jgi:hypothetical protein
VQHRPIFRDVDLLASKHRVDSGAQAGLLGELDEQPECLVIDAILRIIQEDAGSLRRHPRAARRIRCKQVSQVAAPYGRMVIFEHLPYRVFARRLRARYLRSCSHLRRPL